MALLAHTAVAVVFVLATVTSLFGTPFRAAQRSLMPSLASTPEELTASNGASSTLESLAFFVGPAIGAGLIAMTDVATVFFFNAATFVWSMVMMLAVRVPTAATSAAASEPPADEPAEAQEEPKGGFLSETMAGFGEMWRNKDLLVVTGEICTQTVIAGASVVFTVVMAVHILQTGPKGVGYLDSVTGSARSSAGCSRSRAPPNASSGRT